MRLVSSIIYILIFLNLASCLSPKKQAIKYNDEIVINHQKLVGEIKSMQYSFYIHPSDSIIYKYHATNQMIAKSLNTLKELPPFEEDSLFKSNALNLFEYYIGQNYLFLLYIYFLQRSPLLQLLLARYPE